MGLFKRKSDPISARSKSLEAEIAALEAQIRNLNGKLDQEPPPPRVRSTTIPHPGHGAEGDAAQPVFESINHRVDQGPFSGASLKHFNDLGVRKYDLPALLRRIFSHFQGPAASNPKLVSYLAAGSVKGLRPLRYEKRVARNRFIVFFDALVILLWGIMAVFFDH